jgi:hypothetical protein
VPTSVEGPEEPRDEAPSQDPQIPPDSTAAEHEAIVQDLLRRVRYLLTLKGRPPLCLAGVEIFERLTEVTSEKAFHKVATAMHHESCQPP